MITTDTTLLRSILSERPSLAVAAAKRLSQFTRTEFDPNSDASWATVDKLWRAALISRDAERMAAEAQS